MPAPYGIMDVTLMDVTLFESNPVVRDCEGNILEDVPCIEGAVAVAWLEAKAVERPSEHRLPPLCSDVDLDPCA